MSHRSHILSQILYLRQYVTSSYRIKGKICSRNKQYFSDQKTTGHKTILIRIQTKANKIDYFHHGMQSNHDEFSCLASM